MAIFLLKTYGYRLQQKVLSTFREQWVLAFRRRGSEDPFTIVDPPADRFYADPFLAEHNGSTFVFFEELHVTQRQGHDRLRRAPPGWHRRAANGARRPGSPVAYPSLFQWRGEWFMVPETGVRRRVEIWRARRFPDEWALETVAIDGVDACDATLCEHDGRWWMFVTLCVPGGPRADEVSLFHADTPLGPWRPHRANPVVSHAAHARSAGALYRDGGALIRPSQDARGGYGSTITLSRVDRLTSREYRETAVGSIEPTWHPRPCAARIRSRDRRCSTSSTVDCCDSTACTERIGRGHDPGRSEAQLRSMERHARNGLFALLVRRSGRGCCASRRKRQPVQIERIRTGQNRSGMSACGKVDVASGYRLPVLPASAYLGPTQCRSHLCRSTRC